MVAEKQYTIDDILDDENLTLETFYKVVSKAGNIVPFTLRPAQRILADNWHNRTLVIKPRQMGISTYITAVFHVRTQYQNHITSAVFAHETGITQRLLARADVFYNNLPEQLRMPMEGSSFNYKKFKNGSSMFIGTAGQQVGGRGDTINNLQLSEVSFWKEEHILNVLMPAVEGVPLYGTAMQESTPNGDSGYFYEEIQKAVKGSSIWKVVVLYWFYEPEYQIPIDSHLLDGKSYQGDFKYTADERYLVNKHGLSQEQIRWRRYKIDDLGDLFWQEYVESIETCFLTSGAPYYDVAKVMELTSKTRPPITIENGLMIWEQPVPGGQYTLGGDPGQARQTDSAACVTRYDDGPPRQVALLAGKIPPDIFATRSIEIATKYNHALIVPEVNGHGIAYLDGMKNLYAHIYRRRVLESGEQTTALGWHTNKNTKAYMMDTINHTLGDADIPDEGTVREIRGFRALEEGDYETLISDDRHDGWGLSLMGIPVNLMKKGFKGFSGFTSWDRPKKRRRSERTLA